MTQPTFQHLDLIEAENEFSKVCENRAGCPNEARWMAYSDHGAQCGPISVRCCDHCKELATKSWSDWLPKPCISCHAPLPGQVSDHIRFIQL